MNDGGWAKPGVILSTYCFEKKEIGILVKALESRFGVECTIQYL